MANYKNNQALREILEEYCPMLVLEVLEVHSTRPEASDWLVCRTRSGASTRMKAAAVLAYCHVSADGVVTISGSKG